VTGPDQRRKCQPSCGCQPNTTPELDHLHKLRAQRSRTESGNISNRLRYILQGYQGECHKSCIIIKQKLVRSGILATYGSLHCTMVPLAKGLTTSGSLNIITHSHPKYCMLHEQRVAEIKHNYIT